MITHKAASRMHICSLSSSTGWSYCMGSELPEIVPWSAELYDRYLSWCVSRAAGQHRDVDTNVVGYGLYRYRVSEKATESEKEYRNMITQEACEYIRRNAVVVTNGWSYCMGKELPNIVPADAWFCDSNHDWQISLARGLPQANFGCGASLYRFRAPEEEQVEPTGHLHIVTNEQGDSMPVLSSMYHALSRHMDRAVLHNEPSREWIFVPIIIPQDMQRATIEDRKVPKPASARVLRDVRFERVTDDGKWDPRCIYIVPKGEPVLSMPLCRDCKGKTTIIASCTNKAGRQYQVQCALNAKHTIGCAKPTEREAIAVYPPRGD